MAPAAPAPPSALGFVTPASPESHVSLRADCLFIATGLLRRSRLLQRREPREDAAQNYASPHAYGGRSASRRLSRLAISRFPPIELWASVTSYAIAPPIYCRITASLLRCRRQSRALMSQMAARLAA